MSTFWSIVWLVGLFIVLGVIAWVCWPQTDHEFKALQREHREAADRQCHRS